jgi:hypothetical protein
MESEKPIRQTYTWPMNEAVPAVSNLCNGSDCISFTVLPLINVAEIRLLVNTFGESSRKIWRVARYLSILPKQN